MAPYNQSASYRGPLSVNLLEGLRVVSTALNLPGPAACARLRDLGAAVAKIEPPGGDPFESYCPSWYRRLHAGMEVARIDLKSESGRSAAARLLEGSDLLVTAQRPAALERMGLGAAELAARFPRLCHVAITGHPAPEEHVPGHDLTYLAAHGLVTPPQLPATLFADMAGSERAVTTALALVLGRERGGKARAMDAPLAQAAAMLAGPRDEGLTRPGAMLGGALPGYNLYAAREGWVAVAALEPAFAARLAQALALAQLSIDALRVRFAEQTAPQWESWARERDLPIVAVRDS